MTGPLRAPCFSFLSFRFSFSVLPDFFDATLRGDLSAIGPPLSVRDYQSAPGGRPGQPEPCRSPAFGSEVIYETYLVG
jgi:hypothetical protein